ncbi:hypothetical protein ABZ635_16100 [Nocardiopsis sp. NPDC007018]|uniref:hypothetical protein n=1 Tax=Nocardiopsis sp. NPDC007018 TaxID=3155721 RepID=UPI0034046DC4
MTEHPAHDTGPIPGSVPLPGFGPVPRVQPDQDTEPYPGSIPLPGFEPAPRSRTADEPAREGGSTLEGDAARGDAASEGSTPPGHAPEVEHLAATLHRRRAELAEAKAARIGDGSIVHELTTRVWVGVEIPAVVCAAADDPMRLRPSTHPVTCLRCRSRRSGSGAEQMPGQELLWH